MEEFRPSFCIYISFFRIFLSPHLSVSFFDIFEHEDGLPRQRARWRVRDEATALS